MIKGIDVSDFQGKINWAAVKAAGIQFAIIKLGYGDDISSQDDKRFEENVAGCEANGIPWGAYIYSYAMSTSEAKSEAAHCIRRLKGKKPTYPVCFDMEDADGYKQKRGGLTKEKAVSICETFLTAMEDNGYYVSLYASLSWLNGILNDSRLNRFDKWVAQWNTVCEYRGEYGLWQYGGSTNYIESPYVNGINGTVDKDYAYKDYPAIIKQNELNGWVKSPYGWLDMANENGASGWAYNGVNDTPVQVHLYAYKDNSPVFLCAATADKLREDLVGKQGNGYHGFTADYDLSDLGEGEYTIKAFAVEKDKSVQLKGEKTVKVTLPPQSQPETGEDNGCECEGFFATLKKLLRQILQWIVKD